MILMVHVAMTFDGASIRIGIATCLADPAGLVAHQSLVVRNAIAHSFMSVPNECR